MVDRKQVSSELIWQETQHQMLFDLIDEIAEDHVDKSVFARLERYAENHFALEEEYMRQLEYPDIEAHIKAHDRFRQELRQLTRDAHSIEPAVRTALSTFLSEWLTRHIFGIDKQLEAFILSSDSK